MQPPGSNLPAEAFAGVLADGRVEAEQVLARLHPDLSNAELVPKERERGVLSRATPACVLAVDDAGLAGMQQQAAALGQPIRDRLPNPVGLAFVRQWTTTSSQYRSNSMAGNSRAIQASNA